ncbi:Ig-like V-type domain-containing protein FAM187A isoform X2 [Biomphalaria glabrata]|uniref:Ig-like V-type domain-containing protein FAM187A isoform X2 n=1 Tax=Biomphalaria glabrata TaxID=6526 RepID=A0A9W3AC65_BIOGL|nr:Ig-like V-type domain-containing protein FAM187A isoform X2 [Biomphalaria glabrata]
MKKKQPIHVDKRDSILFYCVVLFESLTMFVHWQLVLMFLLLQIFLSFCELRASGKFLNDKSQELKESDQIIVDNKTFSDYWQWLKIKYSFGRRQEFVKRLLPSLVIPQNKSSKLWAFDNHVSDMSSRSTNRNRRLLTLDTGADKYAPLLKTSAKKSKHHRRFLSKIRKKLQQYVNKAADWGLSNKEAAEIFEKYNRCLEEKLNALQTEEFPIKPIMAIEGEKITLDCLICYRPDVDELSQKAAWQVLKHEHTELEDVREGKEMEISKTNTLTIRNIDVNDAGQYFCVEHQDYAAVYQVDVFLTDRRKHISHGVDVPQGDTYLTQRNLRVFTMWAPWGECNTCDRPGQKFRVGQCTVKTIYSDTPVFPRDYPILMFYKDGVPCHSTALPRHIRQIPEIGERFSETIVASCNESCPTQPPAIEITDKSGQVIDVIEPGFHSIHQKPALPPLIKRKVLYEPQNSHLVLHCPGELEVAMIHWTRGERQIDPGSIKRQTRGRVHVDSRNQLHINQLLISDTAVYNCWCKNRKVASLKVIVVDGENTRLKLYISYGGLVTTTIGSFLIVFCICCKKSDKNAR